MSSTDGGQTLSWQRVHAWMLSIAIVLGMAALAALFPPDDWYVELVKPTWQPPGWVFTPIWLIANLLLAASFALVLLAPANSERTAALRRIIGQWACNALWIAVLFGMQAAGLAFFVSCLLWLCTLFMLAATIRVRLSAAWLQVPVFLWVSFALVLNGVVVALNR